MSEDSPTFPGSGRRGSVPPLSLGEVLALSEGERFGLADRRCRAVFGPSVYLRGLVEVTNRCARNCLYCGIRRGNGRVVRYRLSDEDILGAVGAGRRAGLRSFVIQGGEDPEFGAERLARLATRLRDLVGEGSALTFSFGTMGRADYALLRRAGVDRYLLRFETADEALHRRLRGSPLTERLAALEALRELGFELGTGFMTGLPGYDEGRMRRDLELCAALEPDMVGIGPFIPHPNTPLGGEAGAGLEPALRAVAAIRLLLPWANIPATTAVGSVAAEGRERILARGANVLMPNIGPVATKRAYELYPGKICLDEDGLRCLPRLGGRVASVHKKLDFSRGDSPSFSARKRERSTIFPIDEVAV